MQHLRSILCYDLIRLPVLDAFHVSCVQSEDTEIRSNRISFLLELKDLVRVISVESLLNDFDAVDADLVSFFRLVQRDAVGNSFKALVLS